MTGMLEHELPGLGHNKPSPEDQDEIRGTASEFAGRRSAPSMRALEEAPTATSTKSCSKSRGFYSSKDHPWKRGPRCTGKHIISPQSVSIVQSIESHIECYAPLNAGQKHGHLQQRGRLRAQGATATTCTMGATSSGKPAT